MREMKDSGIEWVGTIPINWNISKVKYIANNRDEKVSNNQGNDYFALENIVSWSGSFVRTDSEYDTTGAIICRAGDIAFGKLRPYLAKVFHVNFDRCCSPEFAVFYNFKGKSRYIFYVMLTNGFVNTIDLSTYGVKMPRANIELIKDVYLPFPPTNEQQSIADYLDKKCTEIDSIISEIQRQIEALEEYKRSVITEAVTKGLDPDVEMRDSGDEWIGMIPDHWKIMRIGRLFHLRNEKNYLPMEQVQLLSLYTDIGVFPHGEHEERGNKAVTVDGYNIVKKNDIVVNIILAWMGAIGISNYEGVTSPAYDVYVPDLSKVVPHYFHYVFRTSGIAGECYKYGRGIMMMRWRTYSSEFKLINVPYPNLREQQQIADYLDSKCAEIDSIIAEKKQQIETIEEYKKSLIFEYVTGKKEVPIWK